MQTKTNSKPIIVMSAEDAQAIALKQLKAKMDSTRIGAPRKGGK